jgi:hypothetical protein
VPGIREDIERDYDSPREVMERLAEGGPIHVCVEGSQPPVSFCGEPLSGRGRIPTPEATGDSFCPDCLRAWEHSLAR